MSEFSSNYWTVAQAAAWLRVSADTVIRRLVPIGASPRPGEMRYRRLPQSRAIRIVMDDVLEVLPAPPTAAKRPSRLVLMLPTQAENQAGEGI